jgi:putative nucleotidyltransferase with HDIG domain
MSDDNNFKEVEQPKEGFQLLLDSKYPLLQEFREKCPGTFKHSQALMAMVESISLELDLDVEFMKVCATYHDIGKMFNPKYFTENQLENEDFHKGLMIKMSYEIITRHVSDSAVILLNDHNFPREVIEIISQHHGTNVLKYFYNKSKSKDDGDFRYKSSKPTCVESAVLMIADCVEATARSLSQANKLNPTEVIDDTINGLLDDGQLDEVTMKLGDLKKIKAALGKELEGFYQKRIDYGE